MPPASASVVGAMVRVDSSAVHAPFQQPFGSGDLVKRMVAQEVPWRQRPPAPSLPVTAV